MTSFYGKKPGRPKIHKIQMTIRLPIPLVTQLETSAVGNYRTFSAKIIKRLEESIILERKPE